MMERAFSWFEPIAEWMRQRDQTAKKTFIGILDLALLVALVFAAYALRISSLEMPPSDRTLHYLLGPLLSVIAASLFGIYRSSTRNYSISLEFRILACQAAAALVWSFILLFIGVDNFARSVVLIYFALSLIGMIAMRRAAAWIFTNSLNRPYEPAKERKPIVIYGAGQEGLLLVEALQRRGQYKAVALLDTDYTLVDRYVAGLRVYSMENLKSVVAHHRPTEVVIAKPRQNRTSRRQLVDIFLDHGLKVKTIPDANDIISGNVNIAELQDVKLEDLLGRDPVPPDAELMDIAIKNKVVMITGAGGSIGSELARQVFNFGPKLLVLLDASEFSLFEAHRHLENQVMKSGGPQLIPILGSVVDQKHMLSIMQRHGVQVVLHAAAYKHVRMVQENAGAGILNNVWGTQAVAAAAMDAGVERFVLVSTDKAVRPTSVMGSSKRVAELVVQALAQEQSSQRGKKTIFSIVRFGNVLGSTGSVVPLFKEQIEAGGPVLVTHKDVTRYFMLIPEAAQLVIQAGAMAEGGEVFVLDMGEPIKIVQLAETMIELAGLTCLTSERPDGDIEIKFVGLRDGEKMYEELQIGKDVSATPHPRIMRSNEFRLSKKMLDVKLARLRKSVDAGDTETATQTVLEIAHSDI
jgi:UDP-N-acetylglucosamine 4,6-dehydratase